MPASKSIIAGDNQPKQISINVTRHPVDGTIYRIVYKGEIGAMQSAFSQLTNGSVNAELTQHDNIGTITADFKNVAGSSTPIPSTLELQFNEIEKPIFRAPYFQNLPFESTVSVISAWSKADSLNSDTNASYTETANKLLAIRNSLVGADSYSSIRLEAYDIGRDGPSRTYKYLQPVITYTRVVWPDYSTAFAISDCGFIYAVPNVPSSLFPWFVLPAVANTIGAPVGYNLGWFKTARASTVADGGIQLVEQYTYDSWIEKIYGVPN